MAGSYETRLAELGITLPQSPPPAGNYVPFAVSGNLVFLSGQIPIRDGVVQYKGIVGREVSVDTAYQAARLCAVNLIAQFKAAAGGDLTKVRRILRIGGFVACTPDFTDHPKVINGASDLFVEVFGEAGRHARSAVGAPSLPLGIPVEVDAVIELGEPV